MTGLKTPAESKREKKKKKQPVPKGGLPEEHSAHTQRESDRADFKIRSKTKQASGHDERV
ncbi:hypothetical protein P175DRAFT_0505206, partial [Aspergillus ochraceoroseus IBT 24754]